MNITACKLSLSIPDLKKKKKNIWENEIWAFKAANYF